jgi:hypothetical protein
MVTMTTKSAEELAEEYLSKCKIHPDYEYDLTAKYSDGEGKLLTFKQIFLAGYAAGQKASDELISRLGDRIADLEEAIRSREE